MRRIDQVRDFLKSLKAEPGLALAFIYFFFLLCGYYVIRPVRDALGASEDPAAIFPQWMIEWSAAQGFSLGAFTLQVLFTGTFIVMLILQPFYGALVSRFPRRVFLPLIYLIFIACLLGFHALFDQKFAGRGMMFFIWIAVFNLFAVSVFWSYMADIYRESDAKRLYGYIGAGGTLGAILGPIITGQLVSVVGIANLLLISIMMLVICLYCILKLAPLARSREQLNDLRGPVAPIGGSFLAGLKIVFSDPLFRALALLMFFGVGVGTLLYNEQAAFARSFSSDEVRTSFYANIDLFVNLLTLTIQLIGTRYLLTRFGIRPVLVIPALAISLGFFVLSASPLPLLLIAVQVMTRASEFSLGKPARETIYTQVDSERRYKAKAFIDTAVYRGGDLSFVWAHKFVSALGSSAVFAVGAISALIFTYSASRVFSEFQMYKKRGA